MLGCLYCFWVYLLLLITKRGKIESGIDGLVLSLAHRSGSTAVAMASEVGVRGLGLAIFTRLMTP